MKLRRLILPALSVAGMGFSVATVRGLMKSEPDRPPATAPARSPFRKTLAGAGLVEPASEFVAVAPQRSGVAVEASPRPGDRVRRGDVLFRLDARAAEAAARVREAELAARRADREARAAEVDRAVAAVAEADARLARVKAAPRAEELPPLEARVAELERWVADDDDRVARAERLLPTGAAVERDVVSARAAAEARRAQLAQAR
ncbi:MAG TPA: hypothetical protein VEI02_07905, partial [Planctomycetota bacterium]|nr:hypothetical protein [Planctomycetota bacterium]